MEVIQQKDPKDAPFKSWWKKVTHTKQSHHQKQDHAQVFGVPLEESVRCARAAIAYVDNDVQYVGFIPIIVAKCGSFLKDQGLYTEGVFRMSGSAKRIGQLQHTFNTAPDYGRQLDWKGYSVHDTANVLRRFLNYLPEPVIVHRLYQPFRDVIASNSGDKEKVMSYQLLIEQLPQHHQYLLFYLLDLLSLFSQSGHITKMDTFNLASVFTPGMLLDPEHSMNPAHYKMSQKVIQFLIEHQHCFKMPKSSWFTIPAPGDTPLVPALETYAQPPKVAPLPPTPLDVSHAKTKQTTTTTTTTTTSTLHRSKTVPSKRSRYGVNDPLQVVQLNKAFTTSGKRLPPPP
ncbi:hypothetical protein DFQ28_005702 [Apophysomyces sp. BC1034]|nr:hypothetical protein DFQ30_002115 [Apophysomyces sp. BC1015]KAG0179421.1 hypothetical protein DFQ29_002107 [Apophysomyces sp. BC1021]KAG0187888.1 hypothetical protein DFQ28_005702 [Apophysomyces sp. BC1034]